MPVYRRTVTLPLELTAADPAAADRDALDLAQAAAQQVEDRDVTGALSVGKVTVTRPQPRWTVVYGHGPRATEQVGVWLPESGVDSRLVNGLWVHRPATREQARMEHVA